MSFDKFADFESQLSYALKQAKEQNKRVLVEFGGDWCSWSDKMHKVLESAKFKTFIQEHFIFLKCYAGRDGDCSYPQHLEFPQFTSVPFFLLLSADGEIVATQQTDVFEFFRFYKKYKLFSFFKNWAQK